MDQSIERLKSIVREGRLLPSEPMSAHTSFKIGGPVDLMVLPAGMEELEAVLRYLQAEKLPYRVMGNGSNLLVRDAGLDGILVKIADNLAGYRIEGETVVAEAGLLLSTLSKISKRASLTGLEFASGIPGTLGGAVFMNAGAYGGEMKDVIRTVRILDDRGEIRELGVEELELGYRDSIFHRKPWTVLAVTLDLQAGDEEKIAATMAELTRLRTTKQPLDLPSAGSMFKRPPGYYAGKLIDDAGLRGYRFRDAQISEKHCGFVVNRGKATCEDVLTLVASVQKVVRDTYGVDLEMEVRPFGED